jgi:hypothetical protein
MHDPLSPLQDLLRRLDGTQAIDLETLGSELFAVRARLDTLISEESRFVSHSHYEELCQQQEEFQVEAALLGKQTELIQRMVDRLREMIRLLRRRAGETELWAEPGVDRHVRATRAVEAMSQFERLFSDGNFEDAALVAVNSPEGVLRTQSTWERFRLASKTTHEPSRASRRRSELTIGYTYTSVGAQKISTQHTTSFDDKYAPGTPLLEYCSALVTAGPSVAESIACVECAISYQRWDRVTLWLGQVCTSPDFTEYQ